MRCSSPGYVQAHLRASPASVLWGPAGAREGYRRKLPPPGGAPAGARAPRARPPPPRQCPAPRLPATQATQSTESEKIKARWILISGFSKMWVRQCLSPKWCRSTHISPAFDCTFVPWVAGVELSKGAPACRSSSTRRASPRAEAATRGGTFVERRDASVLD